MKRTELRQEREMFSIGQATKATGYKLLALSVLLLALLALFANVLM